MARVLALPVVEDSPRTVEDLSAEIIRAVARRSGRTPEQLATEINRLSSRRPGLTGTAVRAAASGVHPMSLDLVGLAMLSAGMPAVRILREMLIAACGLS